MMMTADKMHKEFIKLKKEHAKMYDALIAFDKIIDQEIDGNPFHFKALLMAIQGKIDDILKSMES